MTHHLHTAGGDSIGSCIDWRFSRQGSTHDSRASNSDGYSSEDYIDFRFPEASPTHDAEDLLERLNRLRALDSSDTKDPAPAPDYVQTTGTKMFAKDFREMRFPRVSEQTLRTDIEDFFTDLAVELGSLQSLANSFFLNADFLQESVTCLQTLDTDVRILLEKLADLKGASSVNFCQAQLEYDSISGKVLEVYNALKFSMTLLKSYLSSQAEASVVAVEALVSLPKNEPRAVHVAKAKVAGKCIDRTRVEMSQMRSQVHRLIESGNYGSVSYFVPNLNISNAETDFARWSGLWGVLFAMKTTASYICQLLLAGLAHAGEGPAMILASSNVASFNSGWASSLVVLHIHVRQQFNKMQDRSTSRLSCSFMSRDMDLLEFMVQDTKGHLQSLLDQGKILNLGAYLGSWQADKKKLAHNVPRLRQHLLIVRDRLSLLSRSLESLAGNMIEGQRYLAQI